MSCPSKNIDENLINRIMSDCDASIYRALSRKTHPNNNLGCVDESKVKQQYVERKKDECGGRLKKIRSAEEAKAEVERLAPVENASRQREQEAAARARAEAERVRREQEAAAARARAEAERAEAERVRREQEAAARARAEAERAEAERVRREQEAAAARARAEAERAEAERAQREAWFAERQAREAARQAEEAERNRREAEEKKAEAERANANPDNNIRDFLNNVILPAVEGDINFIHNNFEWCKKLSVDFLKQLDRMYDMNSQEISELGNKMQDIRERVNKLFLLIQSLPAKLLFPNELQPGDRDYVIKYTSISRNVSLLSDRINNYITKAENIYREQLDFEFLQERERIAKENLRRAEEAARQAEEERREAERLRQAELRRAAERNGYGSFSREPYYVYGQHFSFPGYYGGGAKDLHIDPNYSRRY